MVLQGCTVVTVEAGEEAVLVKKPYIFGHGGTENGVVEAGRSIVALSTSKYYYSILPITTKERFNDLATKDGTPVDFDLYVTTQIKKGGAVKIHKEFGSNWYNTNVKPKVRSAVRNEVRKHTLQDLRMNPESTISIQDTVKVMLSGLINKLDLPVISKNISLGKAIPPKEVLQETARTASQKQREKTQVARAKAEMARADAEQKKALADKAYTDEFKMTTKQFLKNKELDIIAEKENVTVIFGNTTPVSQIK